MRVVNKYNIFVLEVLKAWIDPGQRNPKTIYHQGYSRFAVDGEIIKLRSASRKRHSESRNAPPTPQAPIRMPVEKVHTAATAFSLYCCCVSN
jgi:hypothetical protein